MRRSLRDSIVGFSLLGGILIFTFFSFWLRGVKLSSKNWHLFAEFNNASGLSKKSPVTYRGILVGSIDEFKKTNDPYVFQFRNGKLDGPMQPKDI